MKNCPRSVLFFAVARHTVYFLQNKHRTFSSRLLLHLGIPLGLRERVRLPRLRHPHGGRTVEAQRGGRARGQVCVGNSNIYF